MVKSVKCFSKVGLLKKNFGLCHWNQAKDGQSMEISDETMTKSTCTQGMKECTTYYHFSRWSEFVDGRSTRECLTGRQKKKYFCFLIFFQSQILTLILQIGLPAWSWAAKWSLGLGRSMGMRWFCLGMYGLAFLC